MFTLKFYSLDHSVEPTRQTITVVSALRYDVLEYAEGNYSIVIYQKTTSDEEGTEFRVCSNRKDYANCYIENSAGKTIGHYTSYEKGTPPDGESAVVDTIKHDKLLT